MLISLVTLYCNAYNKLPISYQVNLLLKSKLNEMGYVRSLLFLSNSQFLNSISELFIYELLINI